MIFLLGATATGKTELGAALATHYDAELIGVDAAQVYRTMNIGAGKPCAEFLRRHPHHLIDIREPHQPYCAAQFCRDALTAIRAIHARGKLPILLGGTMFYFSALENGLATLPSADATVRAQIAREFAQLGAHAMHAKLARIDARTAARIRPSDRQRIGRALEIYALSQRAPSALIDDAQGAHHAFDFPIIKLGLFVAERSALHAAIEARFAQMLDAGLLAEVETIVANLHAAIRCARCARHVRHRLAAGVARGWLSASAATFARRMRLLDDARTSHRGDAAIGETSTDLDAPFLQSHLAGARHRPRAPAAARPRPHLHRCAPCATAASLNNKRR